MTYPTLTATARTIASRSSSGTEADWTRALESVFQAPAALGGQFEVSLVIPGMAEPLPAYAVVRRLADAFDLAFTRDPDYLENTAL